VAFEAKRPVDTTKDEELFQHFISNQKTYIERLTEFVAIPGVSAEPARRPEVVRAVEWFKGWCDKLGGNTMLKELGEQSPGLDLPPVLLAEFGADPNKKTLVVYGHLDVQPAAISDGWDTDPWVLTEKNGQLFGRGATDDKGPTTAWLWVIEAYQKLGRDLPVNLRCVFEGMEESGSVGLPELVYALATPNGFLDPAVCDYVCISDNYYTGKKPCLTHGLRGNVYFHLSVEGSTKDLHSGVIGGSVHEAMTDLVKIMGTLVAVDGTVTIDGIMDQVAPVTEEELAKYPDMDFDIESYKNDVGIVGISDKLLHDKKADILMHRWRYPTLSLHGIEGAFDGVGSKTVIPRKVIGKFSLRTVPDMHPDEVVKCVRKHIDQEWAKLGSPNKMVCELDKASFAWYRDPNVPNFTAARRATVRVHGIEPDLTREGGSIPITLTFEEATGADCVLFPIGANDDMAHSQNEKIDVSNYMNGMKCLALYLDELSTLPENPIEPAAKKGKSNKGTNISDYSRWRKRCKKDQMRFGCDCLDC
jgi:nonspecific dipeptidase